MTHDEPPVPEESGAGDAGSPPRRASRQFSLHDAAVAVSIAVTILMVAMIAWTAVHFIRGPSIPRPKPVPHVDYTFLDDREFGAAEAKVKILVVVPLNSCHDVNVGYLYRLREPLREQIHMRFVDLHGDRGREEAGRLGIAAPSIVIDGSTRFRSPSGEEVSLVGPPRGVYTLGDVRAAIQARLDTAYPGEALKLPKPSAPEPAPEGG